MDHERHEGHLSATQLEKRELVEQIKEQIQNSQSLIIINYKGLTVAQTRNSVPNSERTALITEF